MGRPDRERFSIYVIELRPPACGDPKLLEQNLHADPSLPCLYVGSTHLPVLERYAEHKAGAPMAADISKKYGVSKLRQDLVGRDAWAATRERAAELEQRLARKLRALGYAVRQA